MELDIDFRRHIVFDFFGKSTKRREMKWYPENRSKKISLTLCPFYRTNVTELFRLLPTCQYSHTPLSGHTSTHKNEHPKPKPTKQAQAQAKEPCHPTHQPAAAASWTYSTESLAYPVAAAMEVLLAMVVVVVRPNFYHHQSLAVPSPVTFSNQLIWALDIITMNYSSHRSSSS
jgi:hypothetical protein